MAHVKELVYHTIAFLQMTEQQVMSSFFPFALCLMLLGHKNSLLHLFISLYIFLNFIQSTT